MAPMSCTSFHGPIEGRNVLAGISVSAGGTFNANFYQLDPKAQEDKEDSNFNEFSLAKALLERYTQTDKPSEGRVKDAHQHTTPSRGAMYRRSNITDDRTQGSQMYEDVTMETTNEQEEAGRVSSVISAVILGITRTTPTALNVVNTVIMPMMTTAIDAVNMDTMPMISIATGVTGGATLPGTASPEKRRHHRYQGLGHRTLWTCCR